jgi:hypothetical protein
VYALTDGVWRDDELGVNEVHWYTFTGAGWRGSQIQWNSAIEGDGSKTGRIKVSAYNGNGTLLIYNYGSSNFDGLTSGYTFPPSVAAGTVYVKVESTLAALGGTYAVRYDTITPSTPIPLSGGTYADGTVSGVSRDWYSFSAAAGTAYSVQWQDSAQQAGSAYTGNIRVSAYRDNGTAFFTQADSGYTSPRLTLYTTGTVYILVESLSSSNSSYDGTYAVRYDTITPIPLSDGSYATGTVSGGSQDWYSFSAAAGTVCSVQWQDSAQQAGSAYTGNIKVSAYRDDGTAFFGGIGRGYTTPRTISGYTGTVYILVGSLGSSNPSYDGTYAVRYYE